MTSVIEIQYWYTV